MHIDVFQDTACPWCRIGKQHLKEAIARWEGEPITVSYRTFFLNDQIPAEGYDFRSYMTAKGGGKVPLEFFFDAPTRMGEAAGLTFNFEKIADAPNTTLSHQLIAIAPDDLKECVIDAIYAAYFAEGRNIGDLDTLVSIGAACGMDEDDTQQKLSKNVARDAVIAEDKLAHRMGIQGVPFFLINGKYGISGAQPPEVFLKAFEKVHSLSNEAVK
jgi:predicted DsbA family dithiol-disulfide isomerase